MSEYSQNQGASQSGAEPRRERTRRRRRRPVALTVLIRILQVLGTFLLIGVVTGSLFACYAAVYVRTSILPRATVDLSSYTLNENSVICYYDRTTGQPVELRTLIGSENREYVSYDQIPENLINAVIAIEDKRFNEHHGVDWYRTTGAFVNMFLSMRSTFGASTLTQQTIKNFTEYDDVTVTRKIMEIFSALDAEKHYSKEQILELYLNRIYLGNKCYGVQAASKYYFGKNVWELDLAECASLAGITNNPSLYSPYGSVHVMRYECRNCGHISNDPEEPCDSCGEIDFGPGREWTNREYNNRRKEIILGEMLNKDGAGEEEETGLFDKIRTMIFGADKEYHYITQEEYDQAMAETLVFTRDSQYQEAEEGQEPQETGGEEVDSSRIYSWYEEQVIDEAIELLQEKTDYARDVCEHMVFSGGLTIYCAYDPDAQAAVDRVYNDPSNLDVTSKTGQKLLSAITVVDNSSGYVVAMGSTAQKTVNRSWNYPVDTVKQPGSSIKPLSVYGPALEMGLITPASISDDNPRLLNGSVWPTNDPAGYRGLTTILDGVTRSVNTIAVNTLELVTPQQSYEFMTEKFGFTSLEPYRVTSTGKVLSDIDTSPLALGGLTDGVSTYEMAAAYATYPRNGAFNKATTIMGITDIDGNILVDNTLTPEYILKPSTVYYMNTMLTNVVSTGTGTGARVPGQTVAGKTGTTNNRFNRWFCGYTSYYTAAVWTGYDRDERISGSANPAVGMFQKVMAALHEGKENRPFPVPGDLRAYRICLDCGKLAGDDCELDPRGNRVQTFQLVSGDGPTDYCTCHVLVDVCTDSPLEGTNLWHLATEFCPAESVKQIALVDYQRLLAAPSVSVGDRGWMMSVYDGLSEEEKYCTVHSANWVDPSAEPSEDPNAQSSGEPWEWPWEWPWESSGEPSAEVTQPPAEQSSAPPAEPTGQAPEPTPSEETMEE